MLHIGRYLFLISFFSHIATNESPDSQHTALIVPGRSLCCGGEISWQSHRHGNCCYFPLNDASRGALASLSLAHKQSFLVN